jgi:hypothetical protein
VTTTALGGTRRLLGTALVALVAFQAPPVLAQGDAPASGATTRPFRGLFGGARREPARQQTLDLNVVILGGYDDNVAAESTGGTGQTMAGVRESGGLGNASASLGYRLIRRQNTLFAGARTAFRYYPSNRDLNAAEHSASAGFALRSSRRTRLSANQDVSYEPYLSLSAIPVFSTDAAPGLPAETVDYAFLSRPTLRYASRVEGGYDPGRHTHLTVGYAFTGLDFTRSSDSARMRQHDASAGFSRDVTRYLRLGGRYTFQEGESSYAGPPQPVEGHGGEITIDYGRTLRGRRQVRASFTGGYTRIETTNPTTLERRFDRRVIGSARAGFDVGRTWNVSADYRRGVRQLPGLQRPSFTDDGQATIAGFVGRLLDLTFSGQYSRGETGFSSSYGFTSASGSVQARWAVSRLVAISGTYIFYHYDFSTSAVLPDGMSHRFNRHALRLGLDLWLPLYR